MVIVVWVTPIFMGFQFISHNMEVGLAQQVSWVLHLEAMM